MSSKQIHTPEQKMEFHLRVNSLTIPKDFVKRVLAADPTIESTYRIENVRYGKTVDFHILGILEDISNEMKEKLSK